MVFNYYICCFCCLISCTPCSRSWRFHCFLSIITICNVVKLEVCAGGSLLFLFQLHLLPQKFIIEKLLLLCFPNTFAHQLSYNFFIFILCLFTNTFCRCFWVNSCLVLLILKFHFMGWRYSQYAVIFYWDCLVGLCWKQPFWNIGRRLVHQTLPYLTMRKIYALVRPYIMFGWPFFFCL